LENVDVLYGYLEYFTGILGYFMTICYILCPFVTFFSGFGNHVPRKIWQPWTAAAGANQKSDISWGLIWRLRHVLDF
jgi:hypothetical protein